MLGHRWLRKRGKEALCGGASTCPKSPSPHFASLCCRQSEREGESESESESDGAESESESSSESERGEQWMGE